MSVIDDARKGKVYENQFPCFCRIAVVLFSLDRGTAVASDDSAAGKAAVAGTGFELAAADGSNLRKVLVDSTLVKAVLPFGSNYTLVVPVQGGGGLFVERMADEFINELPGLCKTQWQWKVFKQDLMSNKVALDWEDTNFEGMPRLLLRSTAKNSNTREPVEIRGSRCKGSFEIVTLFTTGGSNFFPHSFLVRHEKKQVAVAKPDSIRLPVSDLAPTDGVLPGNLIDTSGYPAPTAVAAWGLSLCDSRGGISRLAIPAWGESTPTSHKWHRSTSPPEVRVMRRESRSSSNAAAGMDFS